MIRRNLLDLNVLIALSEPEHVNYQIAHEWFKIWGKSDWGVCPLTEEGFVRVTTNPSYRPTPRSMEEAIEILQRMKDHPGYSYWEIEENWVTLVAPFAARIFGHQQVTDAYLLGMAIKRSGRLVTFDGGIQQLAGPKFSRNVLLLT